MRRDFHIYNEATVFLLYAGGEDDPGWTAIVRNLRRAVSAGDAIPVSLIQDDSFNIRFVDEPLDDQERTEWAGMVEWNLRIPSGVLALATGLEREEEEAEEGTFRLEISPGDYRVAVYSYFPGVNGAGCLRAAGDTESLGEWFRRTRPEETMPDWLICRLAEDPAGDPGHESVWESFLVSDAFVDAQRSAQTHPTLDFVVHLIPLAAGQDCRNKGRKGPLPAVTGARKPDRFPMGLAADISIAAERPDFVWRPQSPQAEGLLNTVPQAIALTGSSPALLPMDTLHHLARIPAWCDPQSWAILLIDPPGGVSGAALGIQSSFYVGVEETSGRLLISLKPKSKLSISESMRDIEKALARLPDGTILEWVCGDYTGMNKAGNQRYRGSLRKGVWAVDAAYPEMHGEKLRDAVEFAGHLDHGRVKAGTSQEAKRVLDLCTEVMPDWAAVVKPRAEGAVLTLDLDDAGELWNLGRVAFAVHYGDTWAAWTWWQELYPDVRPWETRESHGG